MSFLGEWISRVGKHIIPFFEGLFSPDNLPILCGVAFLFLLISFFILVYHRFKYGKISIISWADDFILLFEMLFEKIYDFFEEIVGENQQYWVKSFIIGIFFVVLFSNIAGVFFDFLGMMFPGLEQFIAAPTTDANFNIAMAIVCVLLVLFLQLKHLGLGKFFYEYFPLFGKNIISIERGTMSAFLYYPLFAFVKLFDIIISLFVGILDVVGNFAKVISLSFRLTGNMMSGTILLGMLVAWLKYLSSSIIDGFEFPVILPLIIVLQGLLVAVIQAFVFALLTSIFIKVATD